MKADTTDGISPKRGKLGVHFIKDRDFELLVGIFQDHVVIVCSFDVVSDANADGLDRDG